MQEASIETDKEGYLVDLADWSEAVAEQLAANEGISLTVSPAMRVLVKHTREQLGEEKGNSIYLLKLFPGSPAKVLAKISGLPRPTNCL